MKTIENIFVYLLQLGLLTSCGLLLYVFIVSAFDDVTIAEIRKLIIEVFLCTIVVAVISKLVIHE